MSSNAKGSSTHPVAEYNDSPPAYQTVAEPSLPATVTRFPLRWTVQSKKANLINFQNWQYTISAENGRPLFTANWRALHLTLHTGSDSASEPIAKASSNSRESSNCILTLLADASTGRPSYSVVMCSRNYTLPIARAGGRPVLETFEWRRSYGSEVTAIDPNAEGWELIRLNPEANGTGEVVAAWANATIVSLNRVASVRILGSAASGALGDDWFIFNVLSVLRVYQAEMMGSI